MEPFAFALAAVAALGASALPSLLVMRRRAGEILERLVAAGGSRPRAKGTRVAVESITPLGAVRADVATSVLGNRWLLTSPLPGYRADEGVSLHPRLDERSFGALGAVDLGPPKRELPRLGYDLERADLERALVRALPELMRGSYPVISRGEAAWLVRLVLHPAADRALAADVIRAVARFHVTPAARKAGFHRLLVSLESGEGARAGVLYGWQLAVAVRAHLARLGERGFTVESAAIRSSALHVVARDRGVASVDDIAERLERVAELARLLDRARGNKRHERRPCPSCRMVFLDPPAGELADRECPRCYGRLLDNDALVRVVLDPLGKTPGDLKDAARGSVSERAVCPSCARPMSPVLVDDDVIVDLCVGCGATWLEEGELRRLSGGRFLG